jgi:hypothetical protein
MKSLILSFLQLDSLREWHFQENATFSAAESKCVCGVKKKLREESMAAIVIPHPLSWCHLKAEYKGILLRHWYDY